MKPFDPIIFHQLPVIQKIIEDETWLEGERRHCPVSPDDPVVRENVCLVLLRIGQELRESLAAAGPALDLPELPMITRRKKVGLAA
jgi:hypothetical protein